MDELPISKKIYLEQSEISFSFAEKQALARNIFNYFCRFARFLAVCAMQAVAFQEKAHIEGRRKKSCKKIYDRG